MGIPLIHADPLSKLPELQSSDLQLLIQRRTEIEEQLDQFAAILDKNNAIGMSAPLITSDGFPRSDIDVANVRIARTNIIRLRNDYKAVDKKIENAVHEAFKNGTPLKIERPKQVEKPFCFVNSVAPGSPAESAGLMKDDKVIAFGTTNVSNHRALQRMADEVQGALSQGVPIKIVISRHQSGNVLTLTKELIPNLSWGGRGAIGAHFLPISN